VSAVYARDVGRMKIIFLDFDGVLCTLRSHVAQGSAAPRGFMEALDREGVGLLNMLMVQHRQTVRVVVSPQGSRTFCDHR
jgi:hypothetical protein